MSVCVRASVYMPDRAATPGEIRPASHWITGRLGARRGQIALRHETAVTEHTQTGPRHAERALLDTNSKLIRRRRQRANVISQTADEFGGAPRRPRDSGPPADLVINGGE